MRTFAWFGLCPLLLGVAVVFLSGAAEDVVASIAFFVLLAACLRWVALAVRDDDVSSDTIRGPGSRTLAIMGADSAAARRGRRREHARKASERRER